MSRYLRLLDAESRLMDVASRLDTQRGRDVASHLMHVQVVLYVWSLYQME